MKYTLKGTLLGRICADCPIPIANTLVRIYRVEQPEQAIGLAAANPKHTGRILTAGEVKTKAGRLVGEGHTNDEGTYVIELTAGDYQGGPVEIDLELKAGKVSGMEGLKERLNICLTTLQPTWAGRKKKLSAVWDYTLSNRLWCKLLESLGLWVICGTVRDCKTNVAIPGVVVTAFDADWLQDDELGSDTTDGTGRFLIWYVESDFTPTIFPGFNLEMTGGPDLYFHITTSGGVMLLEETQSRGRLADREDVGHCFCVNLCLEEAVDVFENPYFYQIGDFNIAADINLTTGRTLHSKGGHAGVDWGFLGNLKLKGFCPKTLPGDPSKKMHYRFLYVDPANPAVEVPVTGNLVGGSDLVVGARVVPWDQFDVGMLVPTYQDIVISSSGPASAADVPPALPGPAPHGPVPPHILVPDPQGWIRVDQLAVDNGFQGPLMRLRSHVAFSDGVATSPGDTAGTSPATPRNGRAVRIIFETATNPADPTTYARQVLEALVYINNWVEVRLLDLQQFIAGGSGSCTPIVNDVDILYTADHELLRSFTVGINTAAPGWVEPALPDGIGPRGGNGSHNIDVSNPTDWPSCSYLVSLRTQRMLTNGEQDDDSDWSYVTFCK